MEVYHHTTNSSSGCSAQNPGELFFLAVTGEAALCLSYTNALAQNEMLKCSRDILLKSGCY